MNFIDKAIDKIKEYGIANEINIIGCTQEEVNYFENTFGYPLPEIYKEFLLKMGKKAGFLLYDCTFFYDRVIQYADSESIEEVRETIKEGMKNPNADFIVIYSYDGEDYGLIMLDDFENKNFPVYMYHQDFYSRKYVFGIYDSFYIFLLNRIEFYNPNKNKV